MIDFENQSLKALTMNLENYGPIEPMSPQDRLERTTDTLRQILRSLTAKGTKPVPNIEMEEKMRGVIREAVKQLEAQLNAPSPSPP